MQSKSSKPQGVSIPDSILDDIDNVLDSLDADKNAGIGGEEDSNLDLDLETDEDLDLETDEDLETGKTDDEGADADEGLEADEDEGEGLESKAKQPSRLLKQLKSQENMIIQLRDEIASLRRQNGKREEEPAKFEETTFFSVNEDQESFDWNPKVANAFGNKVLATAHQQMLTMTIPLLRKLIPEYYKITTITGAFFRHNPDLAKAKKYTMEVLDEIREKHPDLSLEEQFKLAGQKARKALGISGSGNQKRAAFAGGKGGGIKPTKAAPKRTPLEKELASLI